MAKALLSGAEFSRMVVSRVRRERPDLRVKSMGTFMLVVEAEPGRSRTVSLVQLYQSYCDSPLERDEVVGSFLSAVVYQEPAAVQGTFLENRSRIMPQVVPPSLLDYCRMQDRELASVDFVGGLGIAFVFDESERYAYIHSSVRDEWGITNTDLLAAALENLAALTREIDPPHRIGRGDRLTLVWEAFDGYDASRILLTRDLVHGAALMAGHPIIAIPHRDYMVMFGDTNTDLLNEMADRVREDFESHSYPITSRLFTLHDGVLVPYEGNRRRERMVN